MREHISYLDDKKEVIAKVTFCEVFVPDDFEIHEFKACGDNAELFYTYSYVLSAWDDNTQLLRITATIEGNCLIPDIADAQKLDFEDDDAVNNYTAKIKLLNWKYKNVECDDIRAVFR